LWKPPELSDHSDWNSAELSPASVRTLSSGRSSADHYPVNVCVDISNAEQVTSLMFASSPRVQRSLVLLRDHCGVDVGAKLTADDAAMEAGITVGRGKQ
jgi:hypothetical protein